MVGKHLFLLFQPLGMKFLHLLPVSIRNINRHPQLGGCIFHNLVDVLIYRIDLVANGIYGSTEHSFFTLGLAD